jgi:hypothetical protein
MPSARIASWSVKPTEMTFVGSSGATASPYLWVIVTGNVSVADEEASVDVAEPPAALVAPPVVVSVAVVGDDERSLPHPARATTATAPAASIVHLLRPVGVLLLRETTCTLLSGQHVSHD